jgi:hypothetical protein
MASTVDGAACSIPPTILFSSGLAFTNRLALYTSGLSDGVGATQRLARIALVRSQLLVDLNYTYLFLRCVGMKFRHKSSLVDELSGPRTLPVAAQAVARPFVQNGRASFAANAKELE